MQYVIYYRVSTKKQGDSGLGLEAQRTYVNHFYHDKEVIGAFTDIRSGKDVSNRAQLQAAIQLCQASNATLVVAKIDRLSRNTEDALHIYQLLQGRLEACDVPNLDKFTLTLFMAIADRERELIALRTKAALFEKRKQVGEWRTGSKAFRSGAATRKSVKVNQAKAQNNKHNRRAAAMITSLRAAGNNWSEIATLLNEADFRTARGKSFQAVQVQRLYYK